MGRLAQHGPEFGGAALGDAAMPIEGPQLGGARHEAGLAGDVLGRGEPLHLGENRERREGDDRTDPG
jgi:hypothetical protein